MAKKPIKKKRGKGKKREYHIKRHHTLWALFALVAIFFILIFSLNNLVKLSVEDKIRKEPIEPDLSDKNICQSSAENNLCNVLDNLYGDGYKDSCCSEHNLCC